MFFSVVILPSYSTLYCRFACICIYVQIYVAHPNPNPKTPKLSGAESPGAVRKLMALSDKVRPHNPKVPVGKVAVSPTATKRPGGGPTSPRLGPSSRPVPVNLTPESSCLGPSRKQPMRTGKGSECCLLSSHLITTWCHGNNSSWFITITITPEKHNFWIY